MILSILKKVLPETVGLSIVLLIVLSVIDYLEGRSLFDNETLLITALVFVLSTLLDVARQYHRIKEQQLKDREPTDADILKDDEDDEII
jgi:hypothetical protein